MNTDLNRCLQIVEQALGFHGIKIVEKERVRNFTAQNIRDVSSDGIDDFVANSRLTMTNIGLILMTRCFYKILFEKNFIEVKLLFKHLEDSVKAFFTKSGQSHICENPTDIVFEMLSPYLREIEDDDVLVWLLDLKVKKTRFILWSYFFDSFRQKLRLIESMKDDDNFNSLTNSILFTKRITGADRNYVLLAMRMRSRRNFFPEDMFYLLAGLSRAETEFFDQTLDLRLTYEQRGDILMTKARQCFGQEISFIDKGLSLKLSCLTELHSAESAVRIMSQTAANADTLPLIVMECFLLKEAEINFKVFEAGILH